MKNQSERKIGLKTARLQLIVLLGVLLPLATLLHAAFNGQFELQHSSDGVVIDQSRLTFSHQPSSSPEAEPILKAEFLAEAAPNTEQPFLELGRLRVDLANDISQAEKVFVKLKLHGTIEIDSDISLSLPIRFRLLPASKLESSQIELLPLEDSPVLNYRGSPHAITLGLAPIAAPTADRLTNTQAISPGVTEFAITAEFARRDPFKAQVTAKFGSPTGPPTMIARGGNTPKLIWGDPVSPRPEGNRYEIRANDIETHIDLPVQLGQFVFHNSTVYSASIIEKVDLDLKLSFDGNLEPNAISFPLNFVGTINTANLLESADIVQIEANNTGRPIPGTNYYIYLRFANSTLAGFTEGDGFGAMEDQEAIAEL